LLTFLFIACGVATAAQAATSTEKRFIENLGQWDPAARYHMLAGQAAEGPPRRLELWLTDRGYVYHLIETTRPDTAPTDPTVVPPASAPQPAVADVSEHAVAVSFTGASEPAIEAQDPMPGTFNWLVGERAGHLSGAKSYRQLVYRGVYPGIDVIFDASTETTVMETTYRVAAGARPEAIAVEFDGADSLDLDASGNLVIATSLGDITELRPSAFQTGADGSKEPVSAGFVLNGTTLGFSVGQYDTSRPLQIDPVVVFSRTLGGSSTESVADMHEDATGRYITGVTTSSNFPVTTGAYKTTIGGYDWYAAKFDLANNTLLWATYIGGTNSEYGGASALASNGELVIAGSTYYPASYGFPYVYSYLNTSYSQYYTLGLVRLSADGTSRISGAIMGGAYYTYGGGVKIASNGDVYVTGQIYYLTSYPWTKLGSSGGGYRTTGYGSYDAYVARFNSDFSQYLNATVTAGSTGSFDAGSEVALDSDGNVYVMGTTYDDWGTPIGPGGNYDLFVAKYSQDLSTQYYDTRIGGSSTEPTAGYSYTSLPDFYYNTSGEGLVVDGSGQAWVTGMTASTDFPTTPGAYRTTNAGNYDVFVLALNSSGTALTYSTLIGGSSTDGGRGLAFDSLGNVYVGGLSASSNYPVTLNALQKRSGGSYDFVLSILSPDLGRLLSSTYWGGPGSDFGEVIAVGPGDAARIAGVSSGSFPMVPAGSPVFGLGGGYDGAVVSMTGLLQPLQQPAPTLSQWGALLLALLAGLAGARSVQRRSRTPD
jgi:hypothetical protein